MRSGKIPRIPSPMTPSETLGDDIRIPTYRIGWRRPREKRWAICVFVINEGEKVRKQLRDMRAYTALVDIVIADGGSTDGSLDDGLMEETGAKALLVKTGPGKLSAQMRMAMDYCIGEGYDGVIDLKVTNFSENLYNFERNDIAGWTGGILKYKPKMIHMKNGKWKNKYCVNWLKSYVESHKRQESRLP